MSVFPVLLTTTFLRDRAGLLAVSAGALLWGTAGVVVRIVADHGGPSTVTIAFYRLALSALALAIVAPRRARTAVTALRRHPVALVLTGAGLGGYQALYFLAVQDAGVSVATVISLGLAPIVLTLAEAVRRRRRPSRAVLLTVGCAVIGLLLVSRDTAGGPRPLPGLLAALGTGLAYAVATAINRRLAIWGDPLALTLSASTLGALVLLPFAVVSGIAVPTRTVPATGLLYLGVVATAVAYCLFYGGLRTVSGATAAVLTLLEALAAAALAVLLLREPLPATGVVGALLLLAAVVALYVRPVRPR